MSAIERLAILIDANGSGAIREFQKVGAAAERDIGKADSHVDKLAGTMVRTGAVMVGAGAVIAAGLYAATQEYEKQQLAELKLQNTIKNMPKLAGESSKSFTDQATAIQKVTVAADEQVIAGQAMLGTFNITGDQIREITPLVVDYARKFGVDLVDANKQVGKALDGQIGALRRNGVTVDEAAYKADHFTAVQQALRNQVGGFAEEEAKTFNGQMMQMKNTLGEIAESVGRGAAPAFANMLKPVAGLAAGFQGLNPEIQSGVGAFAAYASVAAIVGGAILTVTGQVIKLRDSAALAKVEMAALNHPIATTAAGAAIAGFAFFDLGRRIGSVRSESKYTVGTTAELSSALVELGRSGQQTGVLADGGMKKLTASLSGTEEGFNATEYAAKSLLAALPGLGGALAAVGIDIGKSDGQKKAIENFTAAIREIASSSGAPAASAAIDQVKVSLIAGGMSAEDAETKLRGARDAAVESVQPAKTLAQAETDAANATSEHAAAAKEVSDALKAAFDPFFAATKAADDLWAANKKVDDANLGLYLSQTNLTNLLASGVASSDELKTAYDQVMTAAGGLTTAQDAAGRTAIDFNANMNVLAGTLRDHPELLQENIDKINGMEAAHQIDAGTAEYWRGRLSAAAGEVKNLDGSSAIVDVYANGLDDVLAKARSLDRIVTDWKGQSYTIPGSLALPGIGRAAGSAGGGGLQEGWNVVGENGPESVWKSGSIIDVYPNTKPVSGLAPTGVSTMSSGAPIVFHVTVQGGGADGGGAALLRFLKNNQGEVKRALGVAS